MLHKLIPFRLHWDFFTLESSCHMPWNACFFVDDRFKHWRLKTLAWHVGMASWLCFQFPSLNNCNWGKKKFESMSWEARILTIKSLPKRCSFWSMDLMSLATWECHLPGCFEVLGREGAHSMIYLGRGRAKRMTFALLGRMCWVELYPKQPVCRKPSETRWNKTGFMISWLKTYWLCHLC